MNIAKKTRRAAHGLSIGLAVFILAAWAYGPTPAAAAAQNAASDPAIVPGGAIAPVPADGEGQATQVALVSSLVEVTIEPSPASDLPALGGSGAGPATALVSSTFVLRNTGRASEILRLRAPLGVGGDAPAQGQSSVMDFAASVNDRQADLTVIDDLASAADASAPRMRWAALSAEFPPQDEVVVKTRYRVALAEDYSLARFSYAMGPGQGWSGPVGRTELRLRLPFSASQENVIQGPGAVQFDGVGAIWRAAQPSKAKGAGMLELILVSPALWSQILHGRDEVSILPGSPEAWFGLAQSYRTLIYGAGVSDASGVIDRRMRKFVPMAEAAYQRSIETAPDSARLHAEYAQLLADAHFGPGAPLPITGIPGDLVRSTVMSEAARALQLDSDNALARATLSAFTHPGGAARSPVSPTAAAQSSPTATVAAALPAPIRILPRSVAAAAVRVNAVAAYPPPAPRAVLPLTEPLNLEVIKPNRPSGLTMLGTVLATGFGLVLMAMLVEAQRKRQALVAGRVGGSAPAGGRLAPESGVARAQAGGHRQPPVLILYGSQTGTCEGLAHRAAKVFRQAGAGGAGIEVSVGDGQQVDLAQLRNTRRLVLITSTTGEGDPPDNIAALYKSLHATDTPLTEMEYCVLALGDSSYTHYCKTGRDFDARLSALGAKRLLPLAVCDVDYEAGFSAWLAGAIASMQSSSGPQSPPLARLTPAPAPARSIDLMVKDAGEAGEAKYSKTRPFLARVIRNENLHLDGASRRTHHVEFSLAGSGLTYQAGDALGVVPSNNEALVDELLRVAGFRPDERVPLPGGAIGSLREALIHTYDITKPTAPQVEALAKRTQSGALNRLAAGGDQALRDYLHGRDWVDLLGVTPPFRDAADFVANLRPLAPRLYSISASPKAHPDQVHVTVSVLRYESHGRGRLGVCSNDLADSPAQTIKPVFIHANKQFRLPANPDAPVIMVGPGTGIAPFRGFLHERAATGARGKNWLFFGCWSARSDYLYQTELDQFKARGVLTELDVAFSRDQPEKVYVQHLMIERAAQVWAWLQEGAYFYVCGDAARMAKDVDRALVTVARTAGGLSEAAAQDYVDGLRGAKRYLRDVY